MGNRQGEGGWGRDGVFSVAAIALKSDLNSTVLDYAIFSSSHF